ncbi:hypothetical protein T440DRAFT_473809 [Plenodomus tracheiphilus IPT5]|uniref:Uncharacterized protein n=1 Tax=Plenodomus tracheiphilus IPT5 TaxID=1408161 RepID=A0A6A7ANL9_9PLEO|nr:hypothetical protein T440DRAFT_473809 [Plenodomus tracheiphilus IPT5]
MAVGNEVFDFNGGDGTIGRRTVVARLSPEKAVLRSGRKIGLWAGGGREARFWRFSLLVCEGTVAEEIRASLLSYLPVGCEVLVGVFCGGSADKGSFEEEGREYVAEGITDVGLVSDECWEDYDHGWDWGRNPIWEGVRLLPLDWDPEECWEKRECSLFTCCGEVAWAAQERIIGENAVGLVDQAGVHLLEREFEQIEIKLRQ